MSKSTSTRRISTHLMERYLQIKRERAVNVRVGGIGTNPCNEIVLGPSEECLLGQEVLDEPRDFEWEE